MAEEKRAELDADVRKTFDKLQAKIEKPACFGKWGAPDSGDCAFCFYHPDCKVNTKDFKKIFAARKKARIEAVAEKADGGNK